MISASLGVMVLPPRRKGTPTSLQNERDEGISHQPEEPSGTRVRGKVSNLERSEGEGTLVVVRQRPPYARRKDSTRRELWELSMKLESWGPSGRRSTEVDASTVTTTERREGPLEVL